MLHQIYNIGEYNNGKVLVNHSHGGNVVIVFKLFGNMYVNKMVKRHKKYSFDDKNWVIKEANWGTKVLLLLTFQYRKLKDCKKSLKVGV